jgi:hypothetical protein
MTEASVGLRSAHDKSKYSCQPHGLKLETPPLEPPLTIHKKAKLEALVKKVAVQAEKIQLLEKSLNIAERINNTDCERAALLHWQVTELEERLTAMEGMVCRMPPSAERDELARVLHAAQEEVVNGYLPPPSLRGSEQSPSGEPEAGSGPISGRVEDEPPSAHLSAASLAAISAVCKHRIRKR